MTQNSNIHMQRRAAQLFAILFIMLVPILDIFRFDSGTGSLIVLGSEWELGLRESFFADSSLRGVSHVTLQFFLKAILPWIVILAVFPLLGAITGRFFCGWFCPEGALFELSDFLTARITGRRDLFGKAPGCTDSRAANRAPYVLLALLSMIAIPLIAGITLTGFFVNPLTVWEQVVSLRFTFGVKAGIIGVSVYMLISSILVRHTICKYVCSAGLMQMLFGWVSPVSLRIKMDTGRLSACTDCRKCEQVCFMNVKPRAPRRNINCVNCGECIEACHRELGSGKGLIEFTMPRPGIGERKTGTCPAEIPMDYKQPLKGGS